MSAIDAFEEPVEVTKSELRQVIREELRKAAGELRGAAIEPVSQYAAHAVRQKNRRKAKKRRMVWKRQYKDHRQPIKRRRKRRDRR